jgi:hypothetical protein
MSDLETKFAMGNKEASCNKNYYMLKYEAANPSFIILFINAVDC